MINIIDHFLRSSSKITFINPVVTINCNTVYKPQTSHVLEWKTYDLIILFYIFNFINCIL